MSESKKALTHTGLTRYDANIKNYIAEQDANIIPSNVRYVQCDGDHDEIKIQLALNAVGTGGTVYVCGNCIITNESTTQSSHKQVINSTAVLKTNPWTILDFGNCSNVQFVNSNPQELQYIFSLGGGSTLRNLFLTFDTETYNGARVNPAIIVTQEKCVIDHCTFADVMPLNNNESGYTHSIFDIGDECKWQNCYIDDMAFNAGNFEKGFTTGAYCNVLNSAFAGIENVSTDDIDFAHIIEFGADSIITGCTIRDYQYSGGDNIVPDEILISRYSVFSNNFIYDTDGLTFTVQAGSDMSDNVFRSIVVSGENVDFIAATNAKITDNFFHAPKITDEASDVIYVNNGECSGNWVFNINTQGTVTSEPSIISTSNNAIVRNNVIRATSTSGAKTAVVPIDASGDSVVQNNTITGLDKPMTLSNTTISSGNVVNGVKDDVITASCATVVVAASNSRNKVMADFVCTGTSDQTAIGQAISALPANGGKVLLLEGTYNIDYMININKANVFLEGMGTSTQINVTTQYLFGMYANGITVKNVSLNYTGDGSSTVGIMSMGNVNNMRIENTAFNGWGCSVNILSGTGHEISKSRITGTSNSSVGILLSCEQGIISDCRITAKTGVQIQGDYNSVHDSYFLPVGNKGVSVAVGDDFMGNRISGNHFINTHYISEGDETNTFTDNITVTA